MNELVLKVFSILEMERRQEFYSKTKSTSMGSKMLNELMSEDLIKKP